MMELKRLPFDLTVCKVAGTEDIDLGSGFFFIGKTDEELSLVCRTEDVPAHTVEREDGWKAFRIEGILDFTLTGILARISGILAGRQIGIFAVSTYNTDYVLVRAGQFDDAMKALSEEGYTVIS